jgi:uncharacterized protein (DUF924 family)
MSADAAPRAALPLPLPGEPAWVSQVLDFWFVELTPQDWWSADPALDARIRARFGALHDAVHARCAEGATEPPSGATMPAVDKAGAPVPAPATPRELLATLLVLDQFSRQLFRGQARAFDSDAAARRIAREAVDAHLDQGFAPAHRLFFYLPFEHSESLADQERGVALTTALGDPSATEFARRHHALIARFGRFPHRNAILGRTSTPDELAALAQPGNAF